MEIKEMEVDFLDNLPLQPVSDVMGVDRGTPIDRYYIDQFILENMDSIAGDVLEIGDNEYSSKYADKKAIHGYSHMMKM